MSRRIARSPVCGAVVFGVSLTAVAASPQGAVAAEAEAEPGPALPRGVESAPQKALPPPPLPGGATLRAAPGTSPSDLAASAGRGTPEEPVAARPPEDEEQEPDISRTLDVGGVLTPQGMLVVEPSFTYAHAGVNRVTFRGTEIVETVLPGVVEAEDADRDLVETALTLRYGLTDRLEVEVRVPWLHRDDRVTTTGNIGGQDVSVTDELDADGFGDVELAGHYQLNDGSGGWPYFVLNTRTKFPTGTGPFEVDRDANGIAQELPTGSGFYSVEPSVTVLYPNAPLVLFANAGYGLTLDRDVDELVGGTRVGEVDPGDAVRVGFGMSFAANERTSFSLSYSQDFIDETETELDGTTTAAEELTVGRVTFGVSHRLTDRMSIDVGTTFGVTDDATDAELGVRLPIRFQLF